MAIRPDPAQPVFATKGRGAPQNLTPTRFGLTTRTIDGDWLDARPSIDGVPPPVRTTVTIEHPKTILARNSSPDLGFDRSVNAYRGCEHGCVYCFARPTHAFHDLSPGLDFETRLFAKPDAANLLRTELRQRGYRCAPLALGTNTDPYQPIERTWRITRQVLEVLAETRHPVIITTKSARVVEDIDLLADMAAQSLVGVAISVTTLDPATARTLEPRACTPMRRLDAIRQLTDRGIPTAVNVSPIVPAITDHELEHILARAADMGARSASFIPVRLPHEVAPLFRAWLDAHFPDRAEKVMGIIRELRGGRDNDPDFGTRMRGSGPWADLLRTRFLRATRKYGLDGPRAQLSTHLFRQPSGAQGELF